MFCNDVIGSLGIERALKDNGRGNSGGQDTKIPIALVGGNGTCQQQRRQRAGEELLLGLALDYLCCHSRSRLALAAPALPGASPPREADFIRSHRQNREGPPDCGGPVD